MAGNSINGNAFKPNAGSYQVSGDAAKAAGCKPGEVLLFGIDKNGHVKNQECRKQSKDLPLFSSTKDLPEGAIGGIDLLNNGASINPNEYTAVSGNKNDLHLLIQKGHLKDVKQDADLYL